MIINDFKLKHIDKESFELVSLLEVTIQDFVPKSVEEKEDISLTKEKPILMFQMPDYYKKGSGDALRDCYKNTCIGFNETNHIKFEKLIDTIYKEHQIMNKISREYIHDTIWNWLIKTKRNAKADEQLSNHLLTKIDEALRDYKIHFILLYIEFNSPFSIGNVNFGSFSNSYFDKYITTFNQLQPQEPNAFIEWKQLYVGKMFASYTVKSEKEKAKSIALKACSLAIDVLKICSNTLDHPNLKLSFDIDSRASEDSQSEIIIEDLEFLQGLSVHLHREPQHYMLDSSQIKLMQKRGLLEFDNFITHLNDENTELETLIVQGIQRLAISFSTSNLYNRIAQIFTILESLLLLDDKSPIIENVSKYSSKLITKDPSERLKIIQLLKSMYDIRSKWMHHAKKETFKDVDLKNLQTIVHSLLKVLISNCQTHKNKKSLLSEIDEAILRAY